mgnify:CR=1 FL=1
MTRIVFSDFRGIAPVVTPYLLRDGLGQKSRSMSLSVPVTLTPLDGFRHVRDLNTDNGDSVRTVYLFDTVTESFWFQGFDTVEFVRGPLPEDDQQRHYFTDSQYPKITREDVALGSDPLPVTSFRLGVPEPSSAPVINGKGGTPDPDALAFTTAYVQTFVTQWDEEGPPSPASDLVEVTPGEFVKIDLADPPANWDYVTFSAVRLYRLNTGSNGTEFQFVDEIVQPLPTEVNDSKLPEELGEVLPTDSWFPPPDETHPTGPLQGMVGLPNGSLAGFTGETVAFSVPYIPHAWPFTSRYTIKDRIVGLSPVVNGVVILTDFAPYVATGNSPEALSVTRLQSNQACVSRRSIVDMGGFVIYASPEGLVLTDGSSVQLVTEPLFGQSDWQKFKPESIDGYFWDGKYVGFYDNGTRKGGFVFNPRGDFPAFTDMDIFAHAGYFEPRLDTLYLAIEDSLYAFGFEGETEYEPLDVNKATVIELENVMNGVGSTTAQAIVDERDANGDYFEIEDLTRVSGIGDTTVDDNAHLITVDVAPGRGALWRSPILNTPFAQSMSDLRVVASGVGRVAVYADRERIGVYEFDMPETGYQFFRLPAGFRAREWEVEVRIDGELFQLDLATARREIKDGQ